MKQTKPLVEAALLTSIYMIVLLVFFYVPLLSFIVMFMLPIPFVILAQRQGWRGSLFMLMLASALSMLLATIFSLPITLLAGIGGSMIGLAIHKGSSAYETWARGTVGFVIGLVLTFFLSTFLFQYNLTEAFNEAIQESLQFSRDMFNQVGLSDQAEQQLQLFEEQIGLFQSLMPVWFVMTAILMALVSQWLSYKLINRLQPEKLYFPKFQELQFPTAIIWFYFLALIITFFDPAPEGMVNIGAQNVLMLAGLFMVIQGFSFIFYYANEKKITKAMPVIVLILSLILSPLLLPLVRILGIIDIGFKLRERLSQK